MATLSIFERFCNHVDQTIFSEENMGSVVAFVVDKTYIDRFCYQENISEFDLMKAVKSSLWTSYYSPSHLQIKGILAIQLYAASKRANSNGITTKNYRDRLVQVLDWDIDMLQDWMSNNQDKYWKGLYEWCDKKGFIIAKSYPKFGAGRYVQYPVQQAERVFTEEELLYLACSFTDSKLQPGEDIDEKSFWRLISKTRLDGYANCSHARTILNSYDYIADGYTQIYNYYLRWDGTYKTLSSSKNRKTSVSSFDIYLDGSLKYIDVRDDNFDQKSRIDINNLSVKEIQKYYTFKREGFILFKKNDIYDNYWEETRYLQDNEDGLAILFRSSMGKRYVYGTPIFRNNQIEIYEVSPSNAYSGIYTESRYYSLEGGLKIARMKFLVGCPPLLRVNKITKFWIDGTLNETNKEETLFTLPLEIGHHYIKFPNQPKIELDIVDARSIDHPWKEKYNKWTIGRQKEVWQSEQTENGIVGLNFPVNKKEKEEKASIPSQWVQFHVFQKTPESNNKVLSLLKNIK